jgi:hypothetical protein
MWATDPTGWVLNDEYLSVIAGEVPTTEPFAWSVEQRAAPVICIVRYDGGAVMEITEVEAAVLAPPPGTSLERYAAFVRAVARAFPEMRRDALAPRVLLAAELTDDDSLYRALADYRYRADVVHPIWAARIAADAGLPPPDAATAAIVGAFADSWSDTNAALERMRVAAGGRDRVSGRYLLGLAEALAEWRVALGMVSRTDENDEDLDKMLITYALPLLELAADDSTRARVDRIRELRSKMR